MSLLGILDDNSFWMKFFKEKNISHRNHVEGATLIEIIIVISIISILGLLSRPLVTNMILRNNFDTSVDQVVGSIRKAQAYAMDGKATGDWGVCLVSGNVRLFNGSCSSPNFSEEFDIPNNVIISGLDETTFTQLRGEPSNILTINISTSIENQTITLNQAGGMEIN
jgi:type II secretory pathway pseudopilin PulG